MAHVTHTLYLAGLQEQALEELQAVLLQARHLGRDSVLYVLSEACLPLASLDEGETLWQIYQAIQEVDGW